MPIDGKSFKRLLSHWASGVTVITCRRNGEVHGMTASSFCSLSLEPPLVLVCVHRENWTHGCIQAEQAFGVQLLASGMEELSDRCAGFQGESGHWLNDLPARTEVTGAPILEGMLAWLDCTLWRAYEGGDHTIFVGEIQAGGSRTGAPLLWFNRGYRELSDAGAAAGDAAPGVLEDKPQPAGPNLA